jgi:hypothetical protein
MHKHVVTRSLCETAQRATLIARVAADVVPGMNPITDPQATVRRVAFRA